MAVIPNRVFLTKGVGHHREKLASFEAALRIRDLAKEVHIMFKRIVVIGNRFPEGMEEELETKFEEEGLTLVGMVPNDDELARTNYLGNPLTDLPADSPAVKAAEAIVEKLGLMSEATLLKFLGQGP